MTTVYHLYNTAQATCVSGDFGNDSSSFTLVLTVKTHFHIISVLFKHKSRDFNFHYLCHPLHHLPPPPPPIDLPPRPLPPPLFLSADYQFLVAVTTNKQLLHS